MILKNARTGDVRSGHLSSGRIVDDATHEVLPRAEWVVQSAGSDRDREGATRLGYVVAAAAPLPGLLTHSPNTAMILGAALSGGDALGLAKRLAEGEARRGD